MFDRLAATPFSHARVDRRWLVPLALLTATLLLPATVYPQAVVDTLYSAPETYWADMALYNAGGKLFVADQTNNQILVFNTATLAPMGVISLVPCNWGLPQNMVVHEGTGALYVALDGGYATSVTKIAVIDADTHAIVQILPDIGYSQLLLMDEGRGRLYSFGGDNQLNDALVAIDVTTNTIVGAIGIEALMGEPHSSLSRPGGLDPGTGRLVFSNIHRDSFLVVQGPAMTADRYDAPGARGRLAIWNPAENKVVLTDVGWDHLMFDLDTETSRWCSVIGDGGQLFFSPLTNRVYTGAEINPDMAVIDGPTDACLDVEVGGGLPEVGFVPGRRQVYFAGWSYVHVLGEDLLDSVTQFAIPGPFGGGVVDTQVLVQPTTQRVFLRSWRDLTEGALSAVLVVDGLAPCITEQPRPAVILNGQSASLSVAAKGTGPLHYHWFQGRRGDISTPVGGDFPSCTTPALSQTAHFWVRVSDTLGRADSAEAVVTVDPIPGEWFAATVPTTRNLNGFWFSGARNGWVVGDSGNILRSTDGGVTWTTQVSGTYRELFDVCFVDGLHGWITGGAYPSFIMKTGDGGRTWVSKPSGSNFRLFRIRFVDALTGWALGELGTILKTVDGGETWFSQPTDTTYWLYDIFLFDALHGVAVGSSGTVLRTANGGATWEKIPLASVLDLNGVFFADPLTGWIVGGENNNEGFGAVFKTTDGGETWALQDCQAGESSLKSLTFPSPTAGWAVGTGGAVRKTLDAGSSWFAPASGTSHNLNLVWLFDPGLGWAVGDEGTVLRYIGLDVNRDGALNALDPVALSSFLAGGFLPAGPGSADLNGDTRLDVLDVMKSALTLAAK